jgi:hypothetical protein
MFLTGMKTETDSNTTALQSIGEVPREYWAKLGQKKIFFGHQSVGYNIIDGIKDILDERDYIKLNIVETQDSVQFDRPVFAHSRVGQNSDPCSKIDSFKSILDNGVGNSVDIAFFKFCYVDVWRNSDVKNIFDCYRSQMEELKIRYPGTMFVHVTVPLRSTPRGVKVALKEQIKSAIGKPGFLDDNLKRQRYNGLLNDAYSEKEPFFDLASVESVTPDGARCYVTKGAEKVFVLVPQYTEDGGHLNEAGRRKVAEQLLITLARLVDWY